MASASCELFVITGECAPTLTSALGVVTERVEAFPIPVDER
jgi:hypothetical protein